MCQPSSEALTHASVYQAQSSVQAVIHVHSPELWRSTQVLQLPHTAADVAYGTPEMAEAVHELFVSGQLAALPLFTMLGHEDGVVAFGENLAAAGLVLLGELVKAIGIETS